MPGPSLKLKPQKKQFEALKMLLDDYPESEGVEEVLMGGAGGGGKSFLGAMWLLTLSIRYPGIKTYIARAELKDLRVSTWPTLVKAAKELGIPQEWLTLKQQDSYVEVRNGANAEPSIINFISAKWEPSDPNYDRFGSYEWTCGWVEEAQQIPERAVDVLRSRVGRWRNDEFGVHPRTLYTCNPAKNWLYRIFYKPWRDGRLPGTLRFVQAFHTDNAYLPESYRTSLENIRDPITRQRIKDGIWEFEEDGALIEYEAIIDSFENPVVDTVTTGAKALTVDAARFGSDRVTIWLWEGRKVTLLKTYLKTSTTFLISEIDTLAKKHGVQRSAIGIDEDGVGGGVVDGLVGCYGFMANHVPIEFHGVVDNYYNLKTQCAYRFAEDMNKRELLLVIPDSAFQPDDPDAGRAKELVIEDLEQLRRWKMDDERKLRIMPKDEIKKNIRRSPDFVDGLLIRYAMVHVPFGLSKEQKVESHFERLMREKRLRQRASQHSGVRMA